MYKPGSILRCDDIDHFILLTLHKDSYIWIDTNSSPKENILKSSDINWPGYTLLTDIFCDEI